MSRRGRTFLKPHDGTFFYQHPNKAHGEREAPSAPTEVPWCTRVARAYTGSDAGHADLTHHFRKVRCPDCGRRLQLMTVDIENGYGDFWPYIPPHKVRITQVVSIPKRRKVTRDFVRGSRGK